MCGTIAKEMERYNYLCMHDLKHTYEYCVEREHESTIVHTTCVRGTAAITLPAELIFCQKVGETGL